MWTLQKNCAYGGRFGDSGVNAKRLSQDTVRGVLVNAKKLSQDTVSGFLVNAKGKLLSLKKPLFRESLFALRLPLDERFFCTGSIALKTVFLFIWFKFQHAFRKCSFKRKREKQKGFVPVRCHEHHQP
eukprot:06974_3